MQIRVPAVCFVAILVFCGGCGNKTYQSYPVKGMVTFTDGTIPTGEVASVLLTPKVSGPNSKGAGGNIGPDGKFVISTIEDGDGAFPGEYKVTFNVFKTYVGHESVVAEKFSKPELTDIIIKVGPGEKTYHEFKIEKAP